MGGAAREGRASFDRLRTGSATPGSILLIAGSAGEPFEESSFSWLPSVKDLQTNQTEGNEGNKVFGNSLSVAGARSAP